MFDNTRAAFGKVLDDFKKIIFTISLTVQCIIIGDLIYKLATGNGFLIANIVLLISNFLYFLFYIYIHDRRNIAKSTKKKAKKAHKWGKRIGKFIIVLSFVYDVVFAVKTFTPISFLLVIFTAFGLILDLLFTAILEWVLKPKWEFIKAGFITDIQPIYNVVNFVHKLQGKEVGAEITEETKTELAAAKDVQLEKDEIRKAEKRAESKRSLRTIGTNLKAMIFKKK